ncbi:MAG: hypothetical protein M3358_14660 [Actinomycetota bacterium]|jgi:hypothetical protein|nr:hypothetical protein [Actinomycetota bacterium]
MRRKTWLLVSVVVALVLSCTGVTLAQQQAEPPDLRQQQAQQQAQQDAEGGARLDKEGVIDSALEVHAAHPDDQHGGTEGHLPPRQENVKVVGRAEARGVAPERIADVNFFGDYAYLAAFEEPECRRGGVYVFSIKNLAEPRQVGFIEAAEGTYVGEGVQIIHVDTPQYEGDVLIHNNEICGSAEDNPNGGVTLVDVSNPREPEYLAEGVGDFEPESEVGPGIAHETHSAFAWDAGRRAYAVLVDDEEAEDVDIMNITNPREPRLIAEYDLNERFPQIIQEDLGTAESFLHDIIVKNINGRWVMLLSYWDGGYVLLDVTDPPNATYIADSDFKNPDPEALQSGFTVEPEGNAHQAEFSLKNNYIVAADEDFSPYSVEARNVTDAAEFEATQGSDTPQIDGDTSLEGQTVFVGRACNGDTAVPEGNGSQIAVVERGVCAFTEKVANVEAAGGYVGIIVMNSEGPDACSDLLTMDVQGNLPTLFVGRDTGFAFFDVPYDEEACRSGDGSAQAPIEVGTTGDEVRIEAFFDGWGYVHLFKNGEGKLRELDTYAIPEAHDPRFAEGFGDLSVHEVAMSKERNDLAYFSYYAGGFRVAKIQGGKLVEIGSYIAPKGNNFWGVQVLRRDGKEYVLASDRDYGLYIFRYIGRR